MNKFKLCGTVKIRDVKHFTKGTYDGMILKFVISYQISAKRSTTFMCSTFNEDIIAKLKENDYIELIDYIPTSDKFVNDQGITTYFNTLIVREIKHIKNQDSQLGDMEMSFAMDNFDVNSFQENFGQEVALVEEPAAMNKAEMLQQQVAIMNSQPIIDTEDEIPIKIKD